MNNNRGIKTKRNIKISRTGLFFLLLLSIAFIRQSGLFPMYYMTSVLIAAFMFAMAWMKYANRGNNIAVKDSITIGKLFIIQWGVYILYNALIYASGNGNNEFIKSSFVQIAFPPIILLGAFGFFCIFKDKAIRYFVYAIAIHYVIIIVYQFIEMGPSDFFKGVISVFQGNSVGNPFEKNSDLVLAMGLLLIYYSDKFVKIRDKNNNHAIIMLLLILLGGKKISFVALIVITVFFVLSKRMSVKRRTKIESIISWIIVALSYAYIYIIDSGYLSLFVYGRGINTMGRIKMYDYIAQFMNMKLSFFGNGYSFANLLLEQERVLTYNGAVYGLHSDVLKMFVEFGTIMFGFWLIYNLVYLPKVITKKYGSDIGNLFWFLTMYLFSTYLTDNTINYYITQTLFVIILLHSIYIKRNSVTGLSLTL